MFSSERKIPLTDKLPFNANRDFWDCTWETIPTEVARHRNDIKRWLATGQPLRYVGPTANGDALIKTSCFARVIGDVFNLAPPDVPLSTQFDDFGETIDHGIVSAVEFPFGGYTDFSHHVIAHFAQALLLALGEKNIDLAKYRKTPLLLKTESGPLSTFTSESDVVERGEALRNKLQQDHNGYPIIVVASAGSIFEKTITDQQMYAIAQHIKALNTQTTIIGITDKIYKRGKPPTSYFPDSQPYLAELHTDLHPAVGAFDITINPTDLMSLLAYFYAADLLITSDSFWAWLGNAALGLRLDNPQPYVLPAQRQIALMPVAHPGIWTPPFATAVVSDVYRKAGHIFGNAEWPSMLPVDSYYTALHLLGLKPEINLRTDRNHPARGMDKSIFTSLYQKLAQHPLLAKNS